MTTLTSAVRKAITRDWALSFPGLGIYADLWLGRCVGPFFQGICLDRSSGNDSYLPTTHVYFMSRGYDRPLLTLEQPLLSALHKVSNRIAVRFHASNLDDAARRIVDASLLPLHGPWGLAELIDAVDKYHTMGMATSQYPLLNYEDVIMAAIWLGQTDFARELLERYFKRISAWPAYVRASIGGEFEWMQKMTAQLLSRDKLLRIIPEQKTLLKAQGLPHVEFVSRRSVADS